MPVMPVGQHQVEVVDSGFTKPKRSDQQPQIMVVFQQLGGSGDTITDYWSVSEKAWPHTLAKLAEVGWQDGDDWEALNDPERSPILGNTLDIVVGIDSYDPAKPRHKVVQVGNYKPGGRLERMDQAEARGFAAQLRARARGGTRPAATSTSTDRPKRADGGPEYPDDVPF